MEAKRVRRSKQEARQAILEAAQVILVKDGLDAVRVQRVAADVGVTDAAVHYHFGNHAGLVEALLKHCGKKLVAELRAASPAEEHVDLRAVSRAMKRAYVDGGAARMLMWLKLAGWRPRGSGMLSGLIASTHAQRVTEATARGAAVPSLTDTKFLLTLLNAVHLAQAIAGDALLRAADAPADAAEQQRFLDWVTARVADLAMTGANAPRSR